MITLTYLQAIFYVFILLALACYGFHKRLLNLELNRQLTHCLRWIRKHAPAPPAEKSPGEEETQTQARTPLQSS